MNQIFLDDTQSYDKPAQVSEMARSVCNYCNTFYCSHILIFLQLGVIKGAAGSKAPKRRNAFHVTKVVNCALPLSLFVVHKLLP